MTWPISMVAPCLEATATRIFIRWDLRVCAAFGADDDGSSRRQRSAEGTVLRVPHGVERHSGVTEPRRH